MGVDILKRALSAHTFEIASNAGENAALVPTKVVRLAIENAASVAGTLIGAQVVVHDKPEPKKSRAGRRFACARHPRPCQSDCRGSRSAFNSRRWAIVGALMAKVGKLAADAR